MSEFSEVPKHLIESVPSAAKHEEDMRRDYQIRVAAWDHGIPEASLRNETVHRYVSVLRDLDAASRRPGISDPTRRGLGGPIPDEGTAGYNRELQERGLYWVSKYLLQDGFPGRDLDVADTGHRIRSLVDRVGGTVVHVHPLVDYARPEPASGLWSADRSESDYPVAGMQVWDHEAGKYSGWWVRPNMLLERSDPEQLSALAKEAQRQGLPPDAWADPKVHATLTKLVYARELVRQTTDVDQLPPAPGLSPSAVERLRAVRPLMQVAVGTIGEEFHPGQLSPAEVTGALEPVARRLGRRIV